MAALAMTFADIVFITSKWAAAVAFVALLILLAFALVEWGLGGQARADAQRRNHAHQARRWR